MEVMRLLYGNGGRGRFDLHAVLRRLPARGGEAGSQPTRMPPRASPRWSAVSGSNTRSAELESAALPTELTAHVEIGSQSLYPLKTFRCAPKMAAVAIAVAP